MIFVDIYNVVHNNIYICMIQKIIIYMYSN